MLQKTSIPSSFLESTPHIPDLITVNGMKIKVGGAFSSLPLPGFYNWSIAVVPLGAMVVVLWMKDNDIKHLQVVNRSTQIGNQLSVLKVKSAVPADNAYMLEPQCAMTWSELTDQGLAAYPSEFAMGLYKLVAMDKTDPDSTKDTGSGNMTFFHPVGVDARANGFSAAHAGYLDAYVRKAGRRPRNWVNEQGMPQGIFADPDPAFKKLFNEWYFNQYGLNPWDEHHLDASEIHRAFALTYDPFYLHQMLVLYYSVRKLGLYVHEPKTDSKGTVKPITWGGAPRLPGWWLTFLAELQDMIDHAASNSPDPSFYGAILEDVIEDITAVVSTLEQMEKLPGHFESTVYGSVPAEMKNPDGSTKPNLVLYQYPVLLWGLSRSTRMLAKWHMDETYQPLLERISMLVKKWNGYVLQIMKQDGIAAYCTPEAWPPLEQPQGSGNVAFQGMSGTSLWVVPALLEASTILNDTTDHLGDYSKAPPEILPFLNAVLALGEQYHWTKLSLAAPAVLGSTYKGDL